MIKVEYSRGKVGLALAGFAAFGVYWVWQIWETLVRWPQVESSSEGLLLLVKVILLSLLFVFPIMRVAELWRMLTTKQPGLIIDEEGIVNHSHRDNGKMAWSDFHGVKPEEHLFFMTNLVVFANRPELNQVSPTRFGTMRWFKQKFDYTQNYPFVIRAMFLDLNPKEIIEKMQAQYQQYRLRSANLIA